MTILFRCYGDQRYGLGHVYRSMTLCRALKRNGFTPSCMIFEDETDDVPNICADNEVPVVLISVDPPSQFDFLIYDMPFVEHEFLTLMKAANPEGKIIALDFDEYEYENVDHVYNLHNHGDFSLADNNLHTKFESGFHLAIIREEFFPCRLNGLSIAEDLRNALVTFGGSDVSGNTLKVLDALRAFPGKHISVIRGPLFKHDTLLNEFAEAGGVDLEMVGPTKNIEQWMMKSDLVICGGGGTMLESMFLGLPTIVAPQTGSEKIFAMEAASKGACLLADLSVQGDLSEKIASLEQRSSRKRLSNKAMELVDGQGVDTILSDILRGEEPESDRLGRGRHPDVS